MPTSNPQINNPEGQSVMDALIEAGVEPSAAYNATEGIRNMSGDNVIAEIGVLRAELTAQIDSWAATTSARLDAVETQMDMLCWVVILALTIFTGVSTAGFFRKSDSSPRREAASNPTASDPSDA